MRARDSGRQLSPASRARTSLGFDFLGLAPQALCFRPLRGRRVWNRARFHPFTKPYNENRPLLLRCRTP